MLRSMDFDSQNDMDCCNFILTLLKSMIANKGFNVNSQNSQANSLMGVLFAGEG